jgi:hypothetical protein
MQRRSLVFVSATAAVIGMTWGAANEAFAQAPAPTAPPPAASAPSNAPATAPAASAPGAAPAPAPAAAPSEPAPAPAEAAPPAADASASGDASVSSGGGLFESSQASADSESSGEEGGGGGLPFDLNGYVRGDAFVGKVPTKGAAEMKAAYGEFALKVTTKKFKYGDAFAEMRLRYGLQTQQRIQLVDLREAYVNLYAGPLDLRLGQQIIVWGRADAVNPTSNLTPTDLRVHSPNEDDRRLGNFAARAFLNFQPFRLEGVWVPLYTPSELPLGFVQNVIWQPGVYPQPRLEKGTEAVRLHLELPAVELSASYLYGYAPLPGLEYSGNYVTGQNAAVYVNRHAYNHHVVGGDFSTTIADWLGVRGEVAYREPLHWRDRPYAPNPDLMYVLGLDHTFDDVSIIAQYIGKTTFKWRAPDPSGGDVSRLQDQGADIPCTPVTAAIDDAGGTNPCNHTQALNDEVAAAVPKILYQRNQMIFGQEKHVQHMVSARIEWLALHQTLSVSALGVFNISTKEYVAFPKVAYQFSDALTATVGGEIFGGPHDTLFGSIRSEMSAVYTELKYSY